MEIKYDIKYFTKLSNSLLECSDEISSEIVNIGLDEWDEITNGAIDCVKDELFRLSQDKQRFFYIKHVFEKIFHEGNNIMYLIHDEYLRKGGDIIGSTMVEDETENIYRKRQGFINEGWDPISYILPWDKFYLHKPSRLFIIRWASSVYKFTTAVSELCYEYEIDFDKIIAMVMVWNNLSQGDIRNLFYYQTSSGRYSINRELEEEDIVENNIRILKLPIQGCAKEGKAKTKKVYLTFDQLFHEAYKPHINKFVEILREVSPPLISDAGAWIGQAGAARVYFEALIKGDIIKKVSHAEGGFALENKFSVNSSGVTKKPDTKYAYEATASIIYKEQFLHEIDIKKKDIETNII